MLESLHFGVELFGCATASEDSDIFTNDPIALSTLRFLGCIRSIHSCIVRLDERFHHEFACYRVPLWLVESHVIPAHGHQWNVLQDLNRHILQEVSNSSTEGKSNLTVRGQSVHEYLPQFKSDYILRTANIFYSLAIE